MFVSFGRLERVKNIMCMCVSWHLFTLARVDYSPPSYPQHKHTDTHTHLHSTEKEVWIMLALSDGQANQTHLETIGHRALKERKVAGRDAWREGKGEESPPLGDYSSCSLSVCFCDAQSHTHSLTNTLRHKQTRATDDPSMSASLAANHSAQTILKGATRGRMKEIDGWEYKVVKLQPSIIKLSAPVCAGISILNNDREKNTAKVSLFCCSLNWYVCVFEAGFNPASPTGWMDRLWGWSLMLDRSEWPTTRTPQRTTPKGAKSTHPDSHKNGNTCSSFRSEVYSALPGPIHWHSANHTLICTHAHPLYTDCGPNKQANQPVSCLEPGTRERERAHRVDQAGF